MTRSIVEEWGLLVKWPSKNDAHRWRRSDDRRTMRPTGRGEYGNNRVQEIVSGTIPASLANNGARSPVSVKTGDGHKSGQESLARMRSKMEVITDEAFSQ